MVKASFLYSLLFPNILSSEICVLKALCKTKHRDPQETLGQEMLSAGSQCHPSKRGTGKAGPREMAEGSPGCRGPPAPGRRRGPSLVGPRGGPAPRGSPAPPNPRSPNPDTTGASGRPLPLLPGARPGHASPAGTAARGARCPRRPARRGPSSGRPRRPPPRRPAPWVPAPPRPRPRPPPPPPLRAQPGAAEPGHYGCRLQGRSTRSRRHHGAPRSG